MDTRETKFTSYFSKIVKPKYVIQWSIKRKKINKLIYCQDAAFIKCPYKLELEAGLGRYNPKAIICIHPYGCEEDENEYVTLEVRIETGPRSKSLKLHSDSQILVKVGAEDQAGKVIGKIRNVQGFTRFRYFYIKSFIPHSYLKMLHTKYIEIIISCNFVSE